MKKKLCYVLLLVVVIVVTFLFAREITINNDNIYKDSTELSRDDTISILDKGANYNNYYRLVNTSNGKEEFYYKDGILVSYINSNLNYWMNITENSREMIIIQDSEDKIANLVEDFEQILFPMETTQLGYYSTIYDKENFEFEYKGIMKLNDRDTYVVRTIAKDNIFSIFEIKYYIDKETGVIVKRSEIEKFAFLTKNISQYDRGIKFDIVTEEDVKRPDLTGYDVVSTRCPVIPIW